MYAELVPAREPLQAGIFDPALAYDADGIGWLAYSSVQGPLGSVGPYVHTHLASSRDQGARWIHAGVINASFDGTLEYVDGTKREGVWRAEVPTIVFDPGDPGREWKMYLHRYFWWNAAPPGQESRLWDYGWIACRDAPAPMGPWSEEAALFAAGARPRAPYHQQQIDLNALHPDLADVVAYSEPVALMREGVLYLSLVAGRAADPTIVLMASDNHGKTWRYVATLLEASDARRLGYLRFNSRA